MTLEEITDALRRSTRGDRAFLEQAPVGIFLYDKELGIADVNERFVAMLQSTRDKLIGLDMRRLRDQSVVPAIERALAGETTTYQGPYAATTSSAQIVIEMTMSPVRDSRGAIIGGMGLVQDVTERVRAQDALRRSEARFRALIERAPDAVVVGRGETMIYVNPSAVTQLGFDSANELVGRSVLEIVHPDDRELSRARTGSLLRGEVLPPQEYRLVRKDGSVVVAEIVGMQVEYDGAPALLAFARDLTERRLIHAKLVETDRLVSMGLLAAGVAHEINNPLSYLSATLDLLASRKIPDMASSVGKLGDPRLREQLQQCREMIDVAREGAGRLRDIVRDLRTFSRDDERKIPVDVRRVLDACVNIAWGDIRQNTRLVREYGDVPQVLASESRLGQVFLNLLVNAAQALRDDTGRENVITLRTRMRGDRVEIEVRDTGPGIPKDAQARIFDPFFTTKPVGEGTGLGLWISSGIVAALGGTIAVDSEPGRGTSFVVSLPVTPSESTTSGQKATKPAPEARPGRLLIVDDELSLSQVLRAALSDEFDVTLANGGREALDLLERGSFDAIVCDLMMPDVSGTDLFEHLKGRDPALADKIIFVSGGAFTASARAFLETVDNPRVDKPFHVEALRALIRTTIHS